MISREELNPKGHKLTTEQEANQALLFTAMNKFREAYGKPMRVTNGVRSWEEHIEIYKKKSDFAGREIDPPQHSAHLSGAACDVMDRDWRLWFFIQEKAGILEDCGLYIEEKKSTPVHMHFQVCAPASGKRVFVP